MKVLIGTPTYIGLLPQAHVVALMANIKTLVKNGVDVEYATTSRTFVHKAQNALAKKAVDIGADLFLLEEDVILIGDDFIWRALNKAHDIVCGPQANRKGVKSIMLWDKQFKPVNELTQKTPVTICHTGATLIRHHVLKDMSDVYGDKMFQSECEFEHEKGKVITLINDGSFMVKAVNMDYQPYACPDLQVYHIGENKLPVTSATGI